MELENCRSLVKKFVRAANPISSKSCRQLTAEGKEFCIKPDENFEFPQGHLLIEYEKTKRPVESISKYWWLFYKKKWLRVRRRILLVFILLNPQQDQIRSESVKILGEELEKRFPELFKFFFIAPDAIGRSQIENVIDKALKNFRK
jgi:hypothetical protein